MTTAREKKTRMRQEEEAITNTHYLQIIQFQARENDETNRLKTK